jgi:hypothetical protein
LGKGSSPFLGTSVAGLDLSSPDLRRTATEFLDQLEGDTFGDH